MTNQQFDYLLSTLIKQSRLIEALSNRVSSMETSVETLCSKTIVVTDLDKDVAQLKIDVEALKDEQEA